MCGSSGSRARPSPPSSILQTLAHRTSTAMSKPSTLAGGPTRLMLPLKPCQGPRLEGWCQWPHFSDGKTETHRGELSLPGVIRLMKRRWGSTQAVELRSPTAANIPPCHREWSCQCTRGSLTPLPPAQAKLATPFCAPKVCVCPRCRRDRLSLDDLLAPGALTLLEGRWLCLLSHVHLAPSRAPCTQQVPTQRVCVGSQGVHHCSANVTPSEPSAAGAEAAVRAPRQCVIACPCPDPHTANSCSPRRAGGPGGASKGCNHQSGGEAGGIASATPIPQGALPSPGGLGAGTASLGCEPLRGGPSGTAPRGPR